MNDRSVAKKILDIIDRRIKREKVLCDGHSSQTAIVLSQAIQDELLYLRKEIAEGFQID